MCDSELGPGKRPHSPVLAQHCLMLITLKKDWALMASGMAVWASLSCFKNIHSLITSYLEEGHNSLNSIIRFILVLRLTLPIQSNNQLNFEYWSLLFIWPSSSFVQS